MTEIIVALIAAIGGVVVAFINIVPSLVDNDNDDDGRVSDDEFYIYEEPNQYYVYDYDSEYDEYYEYDEDEYY
ncbi:MAG: hypothetical protein QNJ55_04615 [Xenococcus sp. MO_188.B8]|nr:hypothetical protein [Xenococcus sp. MO_188.B8]